MKQQLINELSKLEIKSREYLIQYVDFCLEKSNEGHYDCVHHILPKAKNLPFETYSNLKKNKWNASYLSYKNHFIAHYLLCEAVKHQSVSFSFFSMKNKDFKNGRLTNENIEEFSAEYERLKKEYIDFVKDSFKGKVVCIRDGKNIVVDIAEYRTNKHLYTTSSTGKLYVIDKLSGKKIRIDTKDYDRDKHIYHITGMKNVLNITTKEIEYVKHIDYISQIHMNAVLIIKRNNIVGQIYARDVNKDDEIITLDVRKYNMENNITCKPISRKYFDLYTKTEVLITPDKREFEFYRYMNYIRAPFIYIINLETFLIEKLNDIYSFDKDKHIYFNSRMSKRYFIDIVEKMICYHENENTVIYNKKNVKKYLNNEVVIYNKSQDFICPSANMVLAYNIKESRTERVTRDEFVIREDLVGYMNSKAIECRKKYENK